LFNNAPSSAPQNLLCQSQIVLKMNPSLLRHLVSHSCSSPTIPLTHPVCLQYMRKVHATEIVSLDKWSWTFFFGLNTPKWKKLKSWTFLSSYWILLWILETLKVHKHEVYFSRFLQKNQILTVPMACKTSVLK
jgi:hypothetical protein